jgi:Zn ribbon nucleic-acid-binding protein
MTITEFSDPAVAEGLSIAEGLAVAVVRGGGTMKLDGGKVELFLPDDLAQMLPRLREHKPELIALLQRRGGWIACLPACPKCGAYCLHREYNIGLYECGHCGLQGIEERDARIASFLADQRRVM